VFVVHPFAPWFAVDQRGSLYLYWEERNTPVVGAGCRFAFWVLVGNLAPYLYWEERNTS
jgi:hypothetical protein